MAGVRLCNVGGNLDQGWIARGAYAFEASKKTRIAKWDPELEQHPGFVGGHSHDYGAGHQCFSHYLGSDHSRVRS